MEAVMCCSSCLMMLVEQSSQYPNQDHCACVLCVQRLISFGEKQGDAALSTLQSTGAHIPMSGPQHEFLSSN